MLARIILISAISLYLGFFSANACQTTTIVSPINTCKTTTDCASQNLTCDANKNTCLKNLNMQCIDKCDCVNNLECVGVPGICQCQVIKSNKWSSIFFLFQNILKCKYFERMAISMRLKRAIASKKLNLDFTALLTLNVNLIFYARRKMFEKTYVFEIKMANAVPTVIVSNYLVRMVFVVVR